MQEQMGKFEEELRQMKQVAHEGNMKVNEGIKAGELLTELKTLKELHCNTQEELKIKDKYIVSLKLELERAKGFQLKLTEKDDSLRKLKEELSSTKENEAHAMDLLSNFKRRVYEVEAEVANRRLSESKTLDSLASLTREFEQTKIELEKSKVEISSLHEDIESLVSSSEKNRRHCDGSCSGRIALAKELGCLRFELGLAKANLAKFQEREKFASSKANALSDEMHLVRNELKFAIDAEEKSQKALDDLALALKEVAAEASEAKEKLSASQLELEQVKEEAGQLKQMIRNSEEEKALAQREAARLAESLKATEHISRAARKEIYKLRGILKQAINEANAAKAAAGLARNKNIQLKDSIAEKEESIRLLTQENEQLRINEVGAQENVKELKRFLSSSSLKTEDKEQQEEHYEDPQVKKTSSLNLNELNLQQEQENLVAEVQVENPKKAKAHKGSMFDTNESLKSEHHTPKQVSHHRRASSPALSDDGGTPKTDDSDSDRSSSRRKTPLFRRVGDLIKRKSFHKMEPSTE